MGNPHSDLFPTLVCTTGTTTSVPSPHPTEYVVRIPGWRWMIQICAESPLLNLLPSSPTCELILAHPRVTSHPSKQRIAEATPHKFDVYLCTSCWKTALLVSARLSDHSSFSSPRVCFWSGVGMVFRSGQIMGCSSHKGIVHHPGPSLHSTNSS